MANWSRTVNADLRRLHQLHNDKGAPSVILALALGSRAEQAIWRGTHMSSSEVLKHSLMRTRPRRRGRRIPLRFPAICFEAPLYTLLEPAWNYILADVQDWRYPPNQRRAVPGEAEARDALVRHQQGPPDDPPFRPKLELP